MDGQEARRGIQEGGKRSPIRMGQHLTSAKQLSQADIERVLDHAAALDRESTVDRRTGALLGLCFFEPSTRTRLSFEAAAKRLGGDVIDMGAVEASSVSKGETLADTVRVLGEYADALVLRHPSEGAAKMASEFVPVPLINAGDGAGQHPTQTLLDLYTIRENVGLEELTIGIMGDLKYGRTVHSLSLALTNFGADQHLISPESLRLPRSVRYDLEAAGTSISEHTDLEGILPDLDVLYVTRIQRERFPDESEYRAVAGEYRIDAATLQSAIEDLIVMHPLPRVDEIASDVDDTPHAKYFEQAANGVVVRKALLDLALSGAGVFADGHTESLADWETP
jgi:aspartate carbamoyltransferase catalytic subunit